MLPFANKIVVLSEKLLPIRPEETRQQEDRKLVYMQTGHSVMPSVAISQARKEICRMGQSPAITLLVLWNAFLNWTTKRRKKWKR